LRALEGGTELLEHFDLERLVASKESILRDWESVQAQLDPQEWLRLRAETNGAVSNCRFDTVEQSCASLEGVEKAVFDGADKNVNLANSERRARLRLELRDLIVDARPRVAAAVEAVGREMEFLLQWKQAEKPSMDVIRSASCAVRACCVEVDCIVSINEALLSMEAPLKHLRAGKSAASVAQWQVFAATKKERQKRLLAIDLDKVRDTVAKAKEHIGAQFVPRILHLEAKQRELTEVVIALEAKLVQLERAVAAGSRLEAVKMAVTASRRVLERSKQRLVLAETDEKHMREDFADGEGTEAEVTEALCKTADARVLVGTSRAKYEDAVRDLVAVRQAGFPELRCPAPARSDCFSQVPMITRQDLGELHLMPRLGTGSFASVFQIELPLVGLCAFKKLEGVVDRGTLLREAAAMWELRHSEQVVRLLMLCDEPGSLGLVLELVEGGSLGALLHERKERLPESETLQILHDVARGLECVHAHKQVHLDVKSDNVLLTAQRRAKLSDFGSSKEVRNTYRDTLVRVTRQWSAPETLADEQKITAACDVWSFGMLMYEMLTGKIPPDDVPERDLLVRIARGGTPSVQGLDERLVAVMRQCWQLDPTKRPSATQLVALIGELTKRKCLVCASFFGLTSGVLCSKEEAFLCNECVGATMESALKTDSAWRPDGALTWWDTVFELSRMRLAVSAELFERWQAAQLRAKERQVREACRAQMEEERRRWDEMGAVERAVGVVLNNILPFSCPKCRGKLDYDKGCMAIHHDMARGGCGGRFCAFCERICNDGTEAHQHAAQCAANTLRLPWLPTEREARAVFAQVQRLLQIRKLRDFFQQLEDSHRDALFRRIEKNLRDLKIARVDVLGQ
jgi:hypothetical protein